MARNVLRYARGGDVRFQPVYPFVDMRYEQLNDRIDQLELENRDLQNENRRLRNRNERKEVSF
jgi:serine/threonine protein kinase HipA of HipAB toxin-antitoxin module